VTRPSQPPPVEELTVGQLVAEAVRLYGRRFWPSLALGVLPAGTAIAIADTRRWVQVALALTLEPVVASLCFAAASALVADIRPLRRVFLTGVGAGTLIALPAPFLASFLVLPAVAWLALVGLAVPAAVIEGRGLRASLARGLELSRAHYLHALGSLATLTIAGGLTSSALFFLLRGGSHTALSIAAFIAVLVISPLLFLGGARLYFDQAARVVGSAPRSRRRRDADVSHALDPDRPGSADAEVEPRPAARGQP
jgi:hypothetical protein